MKVAAAFFNRAPQSTEITVLSAKGGTVVRKFRGFFLAPFVMEGARTQGVNHTRKRGYMVQAYTGDVLDISKGSYLMVRSVQYKVVDNLPDKSPGTYQAMVYLSKVNTSA